VDLINADYVISEKVRVFEMKFLRKDRSPYSNFTTY